MSPNLSTTSPTSTATKATTRRPSRCINARWTSGRRRSGRSPDVAASLNDLANLYLLKGDYAKAEPLYKRALNIREKALGPEHPNVATSLNNLALIYYSKGDYAKAEPLYKRALDIRRRRSGRRAPMSLLLSTTSPTLYRDKGDYAKAEPM